MFKRGKKGQNAWNFGQNFQKGQVIACDNRIGPVHTLFWVIRAETLDISYFFRSSHPNVFCKKNIFRKISWNWLESTWAAALFIREELKNGQNLFYCDFLSKAFLQNTFIRLPLDFCSKDLPSPIKWEVHSEPCHTSKIELFAKIVDGFQPLTFFVKSSIFDVWQGSKYASTIQDD